MPITVSSAAAGRPVRSATQRTATMTATAARTSNSIVSGLTPAILPDVGRPPAPRGSAGEVSGVDDDRDDDRAAPVGAVRPLADRPGDQLLELLRPAHTLLGGLGQRLLDDRLDLGERRLVVDETAGEEVRRLGQPAGVGVHDRDDGDDALLGE